MYVVTLSVFHNLAIWLLYVNKPEPEGRRPDRNPPQHPEERTPREKGGPLTAMTWNAKVVECSNTFRKYDSMQLVKKIQAYF